MELLFTLVGIVTVTHWFVRLIEAVDEPSRKGFMFMMTPQRVQWVLDRMMTGKYTGFTIGQITDRIAWLWKWRKISRKQMEQMTAQVRYILGEETEFYR